MLPGNHVYTYKHQVILLVPDVLSKPPQLRYAKQDLVSLHLGVFTAAVGIFLRLVLALTWWELLHSSSAQPSLTSGRSSKPLLYLRRVGLQKGERNNLLKSKCASRFIHESHGQTVWHPCSFTRRLLSVMNQTDLKRLPGGLLLLSAWHFF